MFLRSKLYYKRLAETWYQYNIVLFDIEYYKVKDHVYGNLISNLNEAIRSRKKDFLSFFVKKWTHLTHLTHCEDKKCSFAVNVDGNWKCFRLKCAFEDVQLVSIELKPIKIGCPHTPERNSYY